MAVAIIDDDPKAAQVTKMTVEDADFETVVIERDPTIPNAAKEFELERMAEKILKIADAAVCDHRLRPGGFAGFDGAELVARLIKNSLPAVLISQFVDQDYDVSIRHWRAMLPSVLSRDEFEIDTLKTGLQTCKDEIKGIFTPERRRHRVLIRVVDIQSEASEAVVDSIIPAWSRKTAVRFPFAIVPITLHEHLKRDSLLIAQVNIGAKRREDLFFDSFEIPPNPENAIFDNL